MSPLVVVSGLTASGKTTVGRLLSERLAMPLIDKDAILEVLFDSVGCNDTTQRTRLSRASDEVPLRTGRDVGHPRPRELVGPGLSPRAVAPDRDIGCRGLLRVPGPRRGRQVHLARPTPRAS